MTIQPCACGRKPVVVEETETGTFHVGCLQVFMRRTHDEPECPSKFAMMGFSSNREDAVAHWNEWIESKNLHNKDV